jgi:urea transport system permease protein
MALGVLLAAPAAMALTRADLSAFAAGATDERAALVSKWSASADPDLGPFLDRLDAGEFWSRGDTLLSSSDGAVATDPLDGSALGAITETTEQVVVSNVLRAALDAARATQALRDPDPEARLQAAKDLRDGSPDATILPAVKACLAKESDSRVRKILSSLVAILGLADGDVATRLDAAKTLASAEDPAEAMNLVVARLGAGEDGSQLETDAAVRVELERSRQKLHDRVFFGQVGSSVFSGLSLASILLLAALGLAITYGLLGVINMAHGELIMIGAYCTWVVQGLFRSHLPGLIDWYPLAALPVAFLVTALVGIALERGILRFLYGRPLETLLATWGISLFLMQGVRSLFGPQNVEVANPSWMSGAFSIQANLVMPYNRLVIIAFAVAVVVATWLLLTRSRLGLFIRATTQNRTMARCTGVRTARVDMLAFGLGSGLAGLAGVALSQVGNVGPDLGQGYIIDSFLVVVVGGVGSLAGTVWAALGLGSVLKFLEPMAGAVPAKIALLCAIILFIQKKPAGLFAQKGRQAD